MARISKRAVDALEAVGSKAAFLWDDRLSGFGVKCLPSGGKRYVLKYRLHGGGRTAPQRWLSLGAHGPLTPDQARELAQQALAAVARGEDPQGAKLDRRQAPTLLNVWERFHQEHLPSKKPQTRYDYEGQWRVLIGPKLGNIRVEQLTRSEVDRLHKSLRQTPYRANRVLALLSRLMTLCEVWELRPSGSNPCRHVQKFKETARTRFLSPLELERLGVAMRELVASRDLSPSAANAIRLLLLTGARLNEVLSARWQWVDFERHLLALPDSKTGAKPVYLSDAALDVLGNQRSNSGSSQFIFPGAGAEGRMINLRKPWSRVCERADLDKVRLHDLRHTAASVAVAQGASLPVIGRLLGHSQAQTTNRYAHVDTDPALRAANAIGGAMQSILQPPVKSLTD
jgi:integrase